MDDIIMRPAEGRPAEVATPQAGLGWPEFFQWLGEGTTSPGRRRRPDALGGAKPRRAGTERA